LQVCFFIIQLLLLKPLDFRNRVSELVRTLSPEHQLMKDFHSKHMEFHQKFPESFGPIESPADQVSISSFFLRH
jgi:mediator of RNA polymerase II transcription subunit 23